MSHRPVNEKGYQQVLDAVEHDAGVQGGYSTSLRYVLGDDNAKIYSKNMLETLEVSFEKVLDSETSKDAVGVFHKVNALVHEELNVDYIKDYHDLLTRMYDKVKALPDKTQKGVDFERRAVALELYNSALKSYESVSARVEPEMQKRVVKEEKDRIVESVARRGAPTLIRSVLQDRELNIIDVGASNAPVAKGRQTGRAKC